ncbi:MAG TPA: hypothetical protein VFD89_02835 [Clostridia bacterium]|nr:hypothetical protein [Clostridia bacterium]
MKTMIIQGLYKRTIMISLLIFILAICISFLVSNYVIEKTYESMGILLMYNGSPDEENRSLKDAKTYRAIATGTQMMNEITSELDIQYTVRDMRNKIIVSYEDNTDLLYIKTEDGDPEMAFKITKAMMDKLQNRVRELFGNSHLKVVEEPYIPFEPSGPNIVLNMVIAGIFAIFLAVLVNVWNQKCR